MTQIVADCPFCHSQKMAMRIIGAVRTNNKTYHDETGKHSYIYHHTGSGAAICRKCNKPVGLEFEWSNEYKTSQDKIIQLLQQDNTETADSMNVSYQVIIPPQQTSQMPHLPDAIKRTFAQAEKNMTMPDCEEAAVMMYRKTIETTIKTQYPDLEESNLKKQIDKLEKERVIPPVMKEWAHEVRIIGNDGAHESVGVTRNDAEAAKAFTTAFLQYLINLPKEIEERRKATNGNP